MTGDDAGDDTGACSHLSLLWLIMFVVCLFKLSSGWLSESKCAVLDGDTKKHLRNDILCEVYLSSCPGLLVFRERER